MGKKDKILESFEIDGTKYTYKDRYTTEEIQELRAKREELQTELDSIQQKIDEATMEMYDVPNFIGKYINISEAGEESILHVERVNRLSYGIRLHGAEIYFLGEGGNYGIWADSNTDISWNKLKDVKTTDEKDCLALKKKIISQIEKDYEKGFRV